MRAGDEPNVDPPTSENCAVQIVHGTPLAFMKKRSNDPIYRRIWVRE